MDSESHLNVQKGEKENDKLLHQTELSPGGNYGVGDMGEKAPLEAGHSLEGDSLNSSFANRSGSQKTGKEAYLKSLAEEDAPQATCKKKALKVVVTVLFILIVIGSIIIWTVHEGRPKKHIGNKYFDFIPKKRVLDVYNEKDDIVFSGIIRVSDFEVGALKKCYDMEMQNDFCYIFDDGPIFKFRPYDLNPSVHCIDLMWENLKSYSPTDCFNIGHSFWYGIPNFKGGFWPLIPDQISIDSLSYMPFSKEITGHILEKLWISAIGTAVISHENIPISVSFNSGNDKTLCIQMDQKGSPIDPLTSFNYSVCVGPDIQTTWLNVRNAYFPRSPNVDLQKSNLAGILWKYETKNGLPSDTFGNFLHDLNSLGVSIPAVQYNMGWQNGVGDIKFNEQTRKIMMQFLKGKYSSSKLFLPINLACSYMSDNFKRGAGDKLFANDRQTGALKAILYDGESCAVWDTTNPDTRAFLKEAFGILQQAGTQEQTEYPQGFEFRASISNKAFPVDLFENTTDLNAINLHFVDFLATLNKTVLLETAYRMQNRSVFVQVPTLVANKEGRKCLDYVIPASLTAGIHGYPYVMTLAPSEDQVDHELYVRWLQLAVFFPALKVTNAALRFNSVVTEVLREISEYRTSFVYPLLTETIQDVELGYPIIRPMWWVEPTDYKTYTIDDQFLLGNKTLVAPVLCIGARKRDIYLPKGVWKHGGSGAQYPGNQWLRDFPVDLKDMPVFTIEDEYSLQQNDTSTSSN
ncbi:myogenesis-regulating glycosidase-like [Dreissena polymorpha]|uniref:Glycosyl hydrolase family 31 C-terminal domain-containing protein n=1 Tax=Dreissena polymorpha TaxID=45954 RepID=A0A9D4H946_DREPO|nr:myogenesis-regulating glycosidase-like [Dreissena polymorpha]KAH3829708.1 hypothetical protein DPMN_102936 [Dreissena polymorpha]